MRRFIFLPFAMFFFCGLPILAASAPQVKKHLPRVTNAAVPSYPRSAIEARVQGVIRFQVSTDGQRVVGVEVDGGSPAAVLVQAATENIKTWQFLPHEPTRFTTTFRYGLLPYSCGPQCKCETDEE